MTEELDNRFSEFVTVFHDRRLPEPGRLAGYAWLLETYELCVPLPQRLHAIGKHHKITNTPAWRLLTPRHAPPDSLTGHLTFALKWEGLDLLVLKRLFCRISPDELTALVAEQPSSAYARRIWFLYEWLTGERLPLADATRGSYVDALDKRLQYPATAERSARHRVRNNLPGTRDFCPLIFRTEALEAFVAKDLSARAQKACDQVPADILARAAAFLLLEDSKSSYAIEGETPPRNRIERWGQAISQAGQNPLDLEELYRLQRIVIGDERFVKLGLREQEGFVGERDRNSGSPIPSHISARAKDLRSLMDGLIAFAQTHSSGLDPVIAAACLAFGFVYIHPFNDGNGRIHRYLIHHMLAERGFNPPGLVFPVSAAILRLIDAYRCALEVHSRAILPLIEWEPTRDGNLQILNDTGDFYRYFDATPHAEFLSCCVEATIEEDLPKETGFLAAYDRFTARTCEIVDMPNTQLDLLFRFLHQNGGVLSNRARSQEFAALTEEEAERIQEIYREAFDQTPGGSR
jgi:hypothetical protein